MGSLFFFPSVFQTLTIFLMALKLLFLSVSLCLSLSLSLYLSSSLSLSLSLPLSLSLSLLYSLSLTLVSLSPSAPFSIHPLWSLILQTSLSRCLLPLYATFSPPPRNSMCSSSTCSAPGRCHTSVNGFQLCPPLAVQLLSFRLVSASMAAATHSKP